MRFLGVAVSLLVIALVMIVSPLVLAFFMPNVGSGDWLGYWGSLLGTIPSGLIAYLIARYQVKKSEDGQIQTKIQEQAEKARDEWKSRLPYFSLRSKGADGNGIKGIEGGFVAEKSVVPLLNAKVIAYKSQTFLGRAADKSGPEKIEIYELGTILSGEAVINVPFGKPMYSGTPKHFNDHESYYATYAIFGSLPDGTEILYFLTDKVMVHSAKKDETIEVYVKQSSNLEIDDLYALAEKKFQEIENYDLSRINRLTWNPLDFGEDFANDGRLWRLNI